MRIALYIAPLTERNLLLAAQVGVEDVVGLFPGCAIDDLAALKNRVESAGLRLSVIEGEKYPMDRAKLGLPGRDDDIRLMQELIRNMGRLDIPILSYDFLPFGEWSRTSRTTPSRGGALVESFDLRTFTAETLVEGPGPSEEEVWDNLRYFLEHIVPTAEAAGVKLAIHPDDPPLPRLRGAPRILGSIEALERAVELVPSPANGICFCQGTVALMDADIPDTIRRLRPHINFVHFRDVQGSADSFQESFIDDGKTDMVAAMAAYRGIGYDGVLKIDHAPIMGASKADGSDGSPFLGLLHSVGYVRGLLQAVPN